VARAYDPAAGTTLLTLGRAVLTSGTLRHAVLERLGLPIRVQDRMAVVQDNTADTITVFGQHDGPWTNWGVLDLHLRSGSPAIDVGLASTDPVDPDGYPRGLDDLSIPNGPGQGTDLGLFEYVPLNFTAAPASDVRGGSATLHATVDAHGRSATFYFEYGLDSSYGSLTPAQALGSSGEAAAVLAGLDPGATYHYRVILITERGRQYGPDQTFTTGHGVRAMDDLFTIRGRASQLLPVLRNDPTDDPSMLLIASVTQGTSGRVEVTNAGTLRYIPGPDFHGEDTFTYSIIGAAGAPSTATVIVRDVALQAAGSYAGLIGSQADESVAGRLNLSVTRGGRYTGRVDWCGRTYPLRGSFDLQGHAAVTVVSRGPTILSLTMELTPATSAVAVSVTTNFSVTAAVLKRLRSAAEPSPLAGRYTFLLSPASPGTEPETPGARPPGTGDGVVTVAKAGRVRIAGKLADGAPLLAAAAVTQDGEIALYRSLYAPPSRVPGTLYGLVKFAAADQPSAFSGAMYWSRPSFGSRGPNRDGFVTHPTIAGAPISTTASLPRQP
jgi:hypothetical protein